MALFSITSSLEHIVITYKKVLQNEKNKFLLLRLSFLFILNSFSSYGIV